MVSYIILQTCLTIEFILLANLTIVGFQDLILIMWITHDHNSQQKSIL